MTTLTEGPLGFPMTDRQAKAIDAILKKLPKTKEHNYRKSIFHKAPTSISSSDNQQQWDVSWISTETPDRYNDVVVAKGMDDSQFALNPIVTLNHCYEQPPIGRSLWRKQATQGAVKGIQAKTVYQDRPDAWQGVWAPTQVFLLIQAGLLNAKSIGWLPIECHYAEPQEAAKNGWPAGANVIDRWLLMEYAVGTIPVNPETVVQIVSKAMEFPPELLSALGWNPQMFQTTHKTPRVIPFTTMEELQKRAAKKLYKLTT